MKQKYVVLIGENNQELSKTVQLALKNAGINWAGRQEIPYSANEPAMVINYYDHETSITSPMDSAGKCVLDGDELVFQASTFLAMLAAGEIDGQLKTHEVAEDGYKLVTDEERKLYKKPTGVPVRYCDGKKWWPADGGYWTQSAAYAVPSDYIFETDQDMKLNALNAKLDEMNEKHVEATEEIRELISAIKGES